MPDNNGDLGIAPGGYPLGLVPSPPDERDYRYPAYAATLALDELPEDYWQGLPWPEALNQGPVESCVSYSGTVLRELQEAAEIGRDTKFSRQFSYAYRPNRYFHQGPGMIPREYFATLRDHGVPPEAFWPGMVEKGSEVQPAPFAPVLEAARPHRIGSYVAVNFGDLREAKSACFVRGGAMIGVPVYQNFVPDSDGVIPMPAGNLRGYHAMLALRWLQKRWIVPNSWGPEWGGITLPDGTRKPGYCYLPWGYPILEAWTTVDATTVRVRTIDLKIGNKTAHIDGKPVELYVAPFIKDGRTLLGVRDIGEAFGCVMDYGPKTGLVEWVTAVKKEYPWP